MVNLFVVNILLSCEALIVGSSRFFFDNKSG